MYYDFWIHNTVIYVLAGVKGTTYRLRSTVVGEGIKRKKKEEEILDTIGIHKIECN